MYNLAVTLIDEAEIMKTNKLMFDFMIEDTWSCKSMWCVFCGFVTSFVRF